MSDSVVTKLITKLRTWRRRREIAEWRCRCGRRVLEPWKPGQLDKIRRKWDPTYMEGGDDAGR